MTDRWWVRKRGEGLWIAIHPVHGVRGVVGSQLVAFGIAYRAARREAAGVRKARHVEEGT